MNDKSPDNKLSAKQIQAALADDDVLAGQFGQYVATQLLLKRKPNGRYDMIGGDKADIGLARTVARWLVEYDFTADALRGEILRELGTDTVEPGKFVQLMKSKGHDEERVKQTIWNMAGANIVEFDDDWQLRRLTDSEVVPA